jgi:hypothetical protein
MYRPSADSWKLVAQHSSVPSYVTVSWLPVSPESPDNPPLLCRARDIHPHTDIAGEIPPCDHCIAGAIPPCARCIAGEIPPCARCIRDRKHIKGCRVMVAVVVASSSNSNIQLLYIPILRTLPRLSQPTQISKQVHITFAKEDGNDVQNQHHPGYRRHRGHRRADGSPLPCVGQESHCYGAQREQPGRFGQGTSWA